MNPPGTDLAVALFLLILGIGLVFFSDKITEATRNLPGRGDRATKNMSQDDKDEFNSLGLIIFGVLSIAFALFILYRHFFSE